MELLRLYIILIGSNRFQKMIGFFVYCTSSISAKMQNLDYKIVVVGEVSSGKSSFINSLLGRYVCPTSILRKTVIKSSHHITLYNSENAKDDVIELVDYPGFNDANQNTFLRQFLDEIHNYNHVLWITTAEKCLMNETEKDTLYKICDQITLSSKLINLSIIVNKSDMNDANHNNFRFEKNEYEVLHDNMRAILDKDYPFVQIFKHSSYCTFLEKVNGIAFELESQYVDEFNRTIRARHGPQTSNFRKGDIIDYSELLNSERLQNSGVNIPNLIEPYLFATARANRLESFEKSLCSKISLTINDELEFIYDVLIHTNNDIEENILGRIRRNMISMKLVPRNPNTSIIEYLENQQNTFSEILQKVLGRQNNQIDFLNLLGSIMGEILYLVTEFSVFKNLNFKNSGKSEFLYFLLQMDRMTLTDYNETEYFGILDLIKTESKEVQFSKFDADTGAIVPKRINRFLISGGENQMNGLLWNKLLRVDGRFNVIKKIMDTISAGSLILDNEKRQTYLSRPITRNEMIQKKLNWIKYKEDLNKLPKFIYNNIKFWYFNLFYVYLPSLFNPNFLNYAIVHDCTENNRDSVMPNFSDFYNKTK